MPGTPPLGPAPLRRAPIRALAPRIAPLAALVLAIAALAAAAGPVRAQAPAGCPAAEVVVGPARPAAVEAAVSCLVGTIRAERGLPGLEPSAALEGIARRHGFDMVSRSYFAHVSPSGGTVDKRARRVGYLAGPCWILGEDLGWAPSEVASARAVVDAWMESPSHRAVILDPRFREMGIAVLGATPVAGAAGATFVLEVGGVGCDTAPRTASVRSRIRVG
jgi:uncharacterized protein YkwD